MSHENILDYSTSMYDGVRSVETGRGDCFGEYTNDELINLDITTLITSAGKKPAKRLTMNGKPSLKPTEGSMDFFKVVPAPTPLHIQRDSLSNNAFLTAASTSNRATSNTSIGKSTNTRTLPPSRVSGLVSNNHSSVSFGNSFVNAFDASKSVPKRSTMLQPSNIVPSTTPRSYTGTSSNMSQLNGQAVRIGTQMKTADLHAGNTCQYNMLDSASRSSVDQDDSMQLSTSDTIEYLFTQKKEQIPASQKQDTYRDQDLERFEKDMLAQESQGQPGKEERPAPPVEVNTDEDLMTIDFEAVFQPASQSRAFLSAFEPKKTYTMLPAPRPMPVPMALPICKSPENKRKRVPESAPVPVVAPVSRVNARMTTRTTKPIVSKIATHANTVKTPMKPSITRSTRIFQPSRLGMTDHASNNNINSNHNPRSNISMKPLTVRTKKVHPMTDNDNNNNTNSITTKTAVITKPTVTTRRTPSASIPRVAMMKRTTTPSTVAAPSIEITEQFETTQTKKKFKPSTSIPRCALVRKTKDTTMSMVDHVMSETIPKVNMVKKRNPVPRVASLATPRKPASISRIVKTPKQEQVKKVTRSSPPLVTVKIVPTEDGQVQCKLMKPPVVVKKTRKVFSTMRTPAKPVMKSTRMMRNGTTPLKRNIASRGAARPILPRPILPRTKPTTTHNILAPRKLGYTPKKTTCPIPVRTMRRPLQPHAAPTPVPKPKVPIGKKVKVPAVAMLYTPGTNRKRQGVLPKTTILSPTNQLISAVQMLALSPVGITCGKEFFKKQRNMSLGVPITPFSPIQKQNIPKVTFITSQQGEVQDANSQIPQRPQSYTDLLTEVMEN